jgi:hypothetical protein
MTQASNNELRWTMHERRNQTKTTTTLPTPAMGIKTLSTPLRRLSIRNSLHDRITSITPLSFRATDFLNYELLDCTSIWAAFIGKSDTLAMVASLFSSSRLATAGWFCAVTYDEGPARFLLWQSTVRSLTGEPDKKYTQE